MTRPPAGVEERLRRLAGDAQALFSGLADLLNDLPTSPHEESTDDLAEEPGGIGDVRSTVLCVLHDLVRPAVRNLQLAAGSGPEEALEIPGLPVPTGPRQRMNAAWAERF